MSHQQVRELKREDIEKELVFAGFVIISCPMKPDTKSIIKELIYASHKVMMITGDNPLTACHVAKELRFTRKPTVILSRRQEKDSQTNCCWDWLSIDGSKEFPCLAPLPELLQNFDLCLTGDSLQYLRENHPSFMLSILPFVTVCARFAPQQKEYIITTLKSLGYCTLMCGDGTNDVGALKHANVGVSLLSKTPSRKHRSSPTLEPLQAGTTSSSSNTQLQRSSASAPNIPSGANYHRNNRLAQQRREAALNSSQARLQSMLREIDEEQISIVKLGDASIAAPFTSKSSSIACGK